MPGLAVHTALSAGLLTPGARPEISARWRPLWWALSEVGWLDEHLVRQIARTPPLRGADEVLRQIRRLRRARWLINGRAPGRPKRPLVVTAAGRETFARISGQAPDWSAPAREVARRALARVFRECSGPIYATEAAGLVLETGLRWGRVVHGIDVRMVLARWQQDRLLRATAAAPRFWITTDRGDRVFRALARATGEPLPRRPKAQDAEHDLLLTRAVLRMAVVVPSVVGTALLARRVYLADGTWILPDALISFNSGTGPVLVVIEVERRGRYPGLERHIANYGFLASRQRWRQVCVGVVSHRITDGRQATLERALMASQLDHPGAPLIAMNLTVSMIPAWLRALGAHPGSVVFRPSGLGPRSG